MKFLCSLTFSDPTDFCDLAREADANGWDAIAVSDHVVHPARIESRYPYSRDGSLRWTEATPWPDPWVAIAAMAAVTSRLRFLTYVYVLPLRHPFFVAKTVGTAAVMSGDRVALGLGVGWMADEFRLIGQDFHSRGRRTDEMIEILRKLWTGERVEHHGACYDFAPLRMLPAPARPVPLLVGGLSEPALRRAARLGDGWLSDIHTTEELRGIVARLRGFRAEYGRDNAPFSVVAACSDAFDVGGYRRLEDAGVTHLNTMPWFFYGGSSLEEKKAALRRFADEVIAKLA